MRWLGEPCGPREASHSITIADHEARIRENDTARAAFLVHLQDAPRILDRLGSIEMELTRLSAKLDHSEQGDSRIVDAMEATRMVLSELSERIIRMETKIERNGH